MKFEEGNGFRRQDRDSEAGNHVWRQDRDSEAGSGFQSRIGIRRQ